MSRRPPLTAADYATIGKTRSTCEPVRPVPPGEGLSLVLDRPGLSLVGAGAWAAAIPGGRGQRGWPTRPRGGDRSGVILVHPHPVPPVRSAARAA